MKVADIIPPWGSHKGQMGRIGVIGGCAEYTGAPFFAAFSAFKLGCDLSHVFCAENAGLPIKTYGPDLIVHPYLIENHGKPTPQDNEIRDSVVERMKFWLTRLDALVVGPGLGIDPMMWNVVVEVLKLARQANLPLVVDGDGISLICQHSDLIQAYPKAIMTPNFNEFKRLCKAMLNVEGEEPTEENLRQLQRRLGVTIILKGSVDRIIDEQGMVEVTSDGCPRRCGGQGDLLAGMTGVFVCWALKHSNLDRPLLLASHCASLVTRMCSHLAFEENGRSMTSSDLLRFVGKALERVMEETVL
nr:ATP-dependent NAD(P)HX dehydratase [Paratrimastix eleionoma]